MQRRVRIQHYVLRWRIDVELAADAGGLFRGEQDLVPRIERFHGVVSVLPAVSLQHREHRFHLAVYANGLHRAGQDLVSLKFDFFGRGVLLQRSVSGDLPVWPVFLQWRL